MTSSFGPIDLDIPRDRKGEFEPQIVKRNQTDISNIEDRILPIAKEWQNRPLERKYAIVFMDAVHFLVREDNRTVKKAVYVAIGVKLSGSREVLGMWIGGNESAKYWLGVLNEIKNRGVEDIMIVSVDGLTGFGDAIHAVFPQAEIQRCIVHQIRYSTKFISYKDLKPFMADLKKCTKRIQRSWLPLPWMIWKKHGEKSIRRPLRPGGTTGRSFPPTSNTLQKFES